AGGRPDHGHGRRPWPYCLRDPGIDPLSTPAQRYGISGDRRYRIRGRSWPHASWAPCVTGHLGKKLPSASLNALAGLIEKLSKEGDHANLHHLSSELMLELDDVLPIVEAGELLGFFTLKDGVLFLTPLGQAYASASILARKELIASRILRVPAINWIYETLQQ